MPSVKQLAKAVATERRLEELRRCQRDLWYLLTEYLGYAFSPSAGRGLTERMHLPVVQWLQRHRDDEKRGFWCRRGWHKTTIVEGIFLQEILLDPLKTHLYWAGSDDLCNDTATAIASHMRYNEKLRALDPIGIDPRSGRPFSAFPRKTNTKFLTLTPGKVAVNTLRPYGAKSKGQTIRFRTVNSEGAGKHVDGLGVMDDIIGRNTIERSEVQKVTRWVQNTVYRLVDSRRLLMIGTPWSEQSVHQIWMDDPQVRTLILPGAVDETDEQVAEMLRADEFKMHFSPSYQFTNPTFWPADWAGKARKLLAR